MSQENVEIVRSLYDTWNGSGGAVPMERIDPGIEVEMVGGMLNGSYRGHAGLSEALDSFWDYFDESRIDVEDCLAADDDVVVVAVRYVGRGKTSGVEVDARGGHVWTLRAGRVVRWQVFGTKQEALKAAGLRE
jgi:ketosteroid isomerase-like protein